MEQLEFSFAVDWSIKQYNHFIRLTCTVFSGVSLAAQRVKNPPAMQENWVWFLGQEDPLEKEMANHPSVLAWKIPWEDPGRPQSMGSQRVGHDWATSLLRHLVHSVLSNDSFYLVPKNSHHSKGKLLTHQAVYAHSALLPAPGNQSLHSVLNRFVDGCIYSGYSHKKNHMICELWCLTSFT